MREDSRPLLVRASDVGSLHKQDSKQKLDKELKYATVESLEKSLEKTLSRHGSKEALEKRLSRHGSKELLDKHLSRHGSQEALDFKEFDEVKEDEDPTMLLGRASNDLIAQELARTSSKRDIEKVLSHAGSKATISGSLHPSQAK